MTTTVTRAPAMPHRVEPDIVCADLVRIFTTEAVEVQALQGLSLVVERGELVAVVGASGSGKSTLLSILSGLDTPTAGVARVADRDLLTLSRRERVRFRRECVGFVWQQTSRNLLPYLTAAENVAAVLAITASAKGAARAERVGALLDLLEVAHCADRRPAEMSGGEQQRVAIAVGIANEPRVLLADEPTGELDDETSAHVLEAMRAVNREIGITTLIVTHDPAVSEHVARTVQIRDGRTATEVLRSTRTDEDGAEHHVAEEYAVLDKVGRLQLPDDFVTTLDLRQRVRLALEPDHVGVWPAHRREASADPAPADADGAAGDGVVLDAPAALDRPTEEKR
ncbi:ABC transporter ATP-binding protein [Microbacterium sp. QXD-8]|uniref:ABC transporter ATP-binding protein n=1 Tax=Microbacterium psychrotolerans TaxID=3068321 RepID=A0ABU0Z3W3_9MICO|nr:ABC transporter ATP-binding protein [Microbacterium sp. QXD-8]MDQ7879283.1 ABC transporter ATP-binding protein [Microbacterium sp. QXD-8]